MNITLLKVFLSMIIAFIVIYIITAFAQRDILWILNLATLLPEERIGCMFIEAIATSIVYIIRYHEDIF